MFNSKDKKVRELEDRVRKLDEEFEKIKSLPTQGPIEGDADLESYLSEYNIVATNEAKLRKKDINSAIKEVVETMTKELDTKLSSVNKLVEDRKEERYTAHVNAIRKAHPDWEKTFTKADVDMWIEGMPPAFQESYKFVADNGTTEDVIRLFKQFKEETGLVTKKPKQTKVVDKTKQEELKEMETIKTKHGPISGKSGPDSGDYDGAWSEAIRTV